ncbi:hypothetical protein PM082_016368 [Marasmius tenuissimus]|nr:hypothetical protein PM082_016368 [Marasmius tenuissimus]
MPFHRDARRGREAIQNALNKPYDHFLKDLELSTTRPSLAYDLALLKDDIKNENKNLSEEEKAKWEAEWKEKVKWVLGTMYVGKPMASPSPLF